MTFEGIHLINCVPFSIELNKDTTWVLWGVRNVLMHMLDPRITLRFNREANVFTKHISTHSGD